MDPEQTFIRVQERFSQMMTPRVRPTLEYLYLFVAIVLFCVLVVMHANYVQQPGCSSELLEVGYVQAQLIQIKITSDGIWSQDEGNPNAIETAEEETLSGILIVSTVNGEANLYAANYLLNWIRSSFRSKLASKLWMSNTEHHENIAYSSVGSQSRRSSTENVGCKDAEYVSSSFTMTARESIKAGIRHFVNKWFRRFSFLWRLVTCEIPIKGNSEVMECCGYTTAF